MDNAPPPSEPDALRADLRRLYAEVDAAIAAAGPVCQISGRCCRFEEYGHTLFVSAPEFALLLDEAPPPVRPLDDGATCPWQDGCGRCSAREARPLGCRIYHCDPAFQEALPVLGEAFTNALKRLVELHDAPWDYAPLHRHLNAARERGGLCPRPPESPPASGQQGPSDPPERVLGP